jgi:hypothetical protein
MRLENFERQRELIATQIIYCKNKIPELPLQQLDIREIEEKVQKSILTHPIFTFLVIVS